MKHQWVLVMAILLLGVLAFTAELRADRWKKDSEQAREQLHLCYEIARNEG